MRIHSLLIWSLSGYTSILQRTTRWHGFPFPSFSLCKFQKLRQICYECCLLFATSCVFFSSLPLSSLSLSLSLCLSLSPSHLFLSLSSFEAALSPLLRGGFVSLPLSRSDARALLRGFLLFVFGLWQTVRREFLAAGSADAVVRVSVNEASCAHAAPPNRVELSDSRARTPSVAHPRMLIAVDANCNFTGMWPHGVTVSTLDSESSDRGLNPREAFQNDI